MFLVGIDIGTGGCGTTVLKEDGEVVSTAFEEYPTQHPRAGWAEQDPQDWITGAKNTLKKVMDNPQISPSEVASICIDGTPHTPVLLDEDEDVIRPPILYTDKRSEEQANYLDREFGDLIFDITYNRPTQAWTMPMLLWVKQKEPETWKKIDRILLPKDYVRLKFCGDSATDFTDAASTLLMDMEKKNWSEELCEIIELPPDVLPPIVPPTEVAGELKKIGNGENIRKLEGTPVVTGADDVCAENFGAGLIEEGQFSLKLATTGRVSWLTEKPYKYESQQHRIVTYPHVNSETLLSGMAFTSPSESLRWLRDTFAHEEMCVAENMEKSVYELMDIEAETVPEGSKGLIFHPHLGSFVTSVRGNFFGVQSYHRKKHFIRALLEGVSFSLKRGYNILKDEILQERKVQLNQEAVLLGGGARSELWSQIMSDVFGIKMIIPRTADASFGAALIGGIGVDIFDDFGDTLDRCQIYSREVKPDSESNSLYEELFSIYEDIENFLPKISERLEKIYDKRNSE